MALQMMRLSKQNHVTCTIWREATRKLLTVLDSHLTDSSSLADPMIKWLLFGNSSLCQ